MKQRIYLCIIFLSLFSLLKAESDGHFPKLLKSLQSPQMKADEKAKLLGDYVKQSTDPDAMLTASLLQQCFLIPGPRDVKTLEIEESLISLGAQRPNGWQFKFAQFALLNLLHTDGQDQRVIQLGEPQLTAGYFDVFDSSDDRQLVLLKSAYPINSENMRKLVMTQLAIAYDRVGNTDRAAEIRSENPIVSASEIETKKSQGSEPSSLPEQKMPIQPEKHASWEWLIYGLLLLILIGGVLFKFLHK